MKHKLIVLMGPDGSGKTTVAKSLVRHLRQKGVYVVYNHGHTYITSGNSFGIQEATLEKRRIFFQLLLPFAYFDNVFAFVFKYLFKKGTIISDRYLYDKAVRLAYYGILPAWLFSPYLRLLPRPDVIYCLDAPEKSIVKRKSGMSREELVRYRRLYVKAAQILGAHIVNTDRPIKSTLKSIIPLL